jgi:hypothetical protein
VFVQDGLQILWVDNNTGVVDVPREDSKDGGFTRSPEGTYPRSAKDWTLGRILLPKVSHTPRG